MEFEKLLELVSVFDNSGLTSLAFETDDCKIKLEKSGSPIPTSPAAESASAQTIESKTQPAAAVKKESGTTVTAPIVGVVYCASAPGKEPFITLGQSVKKGDILCLIEAMKTINEVKAPVSGTVKEICFTDGELKEFGALLAVIGES